MAEPPRQDGQGCPAAQPLPAVVLPLRLKTAGDGPASLASPDGPCPVTRLPVSNSGSLDGSGPAAQQGMRQHEPEDTLTRIAAGIFQAGLALEAALDQPADGLRQAAKHALDLLDETIREARDAAFAAHGHTAHSPDDPGDPATAREGPARAALGEAQALLARSGSIRTRSREVRARTLKVAVLSAATQDRIAATLGQLATRYPRHSADLRELSQAAASHAARLRRWADGHPASG